MDNSGIPRPKNLSKKTLGDILDAAHQHDSVPENFHSPPSSPEPPGLVLDTLKLYLSKKDQHVARAKYEYYVRFKKDPPQQWHRYVSSFLPPGVYPPSFKRPRFTDQTQPVDNLHTTTQGPVHDLDDIFNLLDLPPAPISLESPNKSNFTDLDGIGLPEY